MLLSSSLSRVPGLTSVSILLFGLLILAVVVGVWRSIGVCLRLCEADLVVVVAQVDDDSYGCGVNGGTEWERYSYRARAGRVGSREIVAEKVAEYG